jgi:hypothetical protein
MTLTTTHNRLAYVGNGSTTVYPYTFLITAATDLRVYHDGVQQTSGYTLSGVGLGLGGTVTYATAPATGVEIIFLRVTDQTQQVDLIEGDRLPAESVEGMFDKVYAVAQDLAERMDRTVRIPPTSDFAGETIFLPDPADEANQGKALFISEDGTALEARTILSSDIASPISAQGDLIRGSSSATPERLPVGIAGQLLTVVAGQAAWATPSASGIQATIFDAKGDLMTATAADTPIRKAVGANTTLLQADSAQADGLVWTNPNTLPGTTYSTHTAIADPATPATPTVLAYTPTGVTGLQRRRWIDAAGQKTDAQGIPSHLRFTGNPYKDVNTTSAQVSVFSAAPTIYAGTLGTNRGLRINVLGDVLQNAGATLRGFTLRFKYGATTFATVDTVGTYGQSATRRGWKSVAELVAIGAANAQIGHAFILAASTVGIVGGAANAFGPGSYNGVSLHTTVAENSATNLTLDLTIQPEVSNAALSIRVFSVLVEWC